MNEEQIRDIIREELAVLIKSDKYVFNKLIQILDGRAIQAGRTHGLTICTAEDQKLGFYGTTPVVKQDAIAQPSGGITVDGEARSAIGDIRVALQNIGIIKP